MPAHRPEMATSALVPALREGLVLHAARRVGLAAAIATALAVTWTGLLVLDNIYGPLGERTWAAYPLALAGGASVAVAVHRAVSLAAHRSAAAVAALLVLLLATGWVLLPRQVDVHESFEPQPNERSSCAGWSFRYYPPETFDASARVYCVGLETPLPPG